MAGHQAALAMRKDQENQVLNTPNPTHNTISLETEEEVVEEAEEATGKKAANSGGMKTVENSNIVVMTIKDGKTKKKEVEKHCTSVGSTLPPSGPCLSHRPVRWEGGG